MKRLCVFTLGALIVCLNATAQTAVHGTYYNEAYETADRVDGEIHVVTPYGKASSFLYKADTYGTINVYDEVTNQIVMYGQVYENGTKVMVKAGQPKPPKPPRPVVKPSVRGLGWGPVVCYAGEAASLARCELQCRNTGVAEYGTGYCGFNTTCKCNEPPPPPPSPTPTPANGWNFTPPWQTIVEWNGGERDLGIEYEEP